MPAAEPTGPISDGELAALFAPLDSASRIALAVSGGGDSLALFDCIDRWRRSRTSPPDVIVLTVDHGLRSSSKTDAVAVMALARERGLEAQTLRWTGEKPRSDIEAAARAARYRLLLAASKQAKLSHLVLAHHRDDQAETLLLRLARGSGVFGLAAMRPEISVGELTIFRPFLGVPKVRLSETIAAVGIEPVEDTMNMDSRFARVSMRRIMPLLAGNGIEPAGLAATAQRLAAAAEALDMVATTLIGAVVEVDDFATASIDAAVFLDAPREIRLRSLLRILLAVGGDQYPPRFERLAALADDIERHNNRVRFKRTLSGAVIEWRRGRFLVYREIGRSGLSKIAVRPGFTGLWDQRFHVEIGSGAPEGLELAALGEAGRREIGIRPRNAVPGALAALPALWHGETVGAVPSLGYFGKGGQGYGALVRPILADRLSVPPRFPDFLTSI